MNECLCTGPAYGTYELPRRTGQSEILSSCNIIAHNIGSGSDHIAECVWISCDSDERDGDRISECATSSCPINVIPDIVGSNMEATK